MKTNNFLKALLLPILVLSLAFVNTSCEKNNDDNTPETYKISGDASGSQEVPAVVVTGTATLTGTYNADNNTLDYAINWNGLSNIVLDAHFHGPALAGANADAIHNLAITTNGVSGVSTGSIVLADTTEAHLLAGRIYYNLHTALHPTGEIRGQVSTVINN